MTSYKVPLREQLRNSTLIYEGRFYVRRMVNFMKIAKVNAYIMYIFGKIELSSIHAT